MVATVVMATKVATKAEETAAVVAVTEVQEAVVVRAVVAQSEVWVGWGGWGVARAVDLVRRKRVLCPAYPGRRCHNPVHHLCVQGGSTFPEGHNSCTSPSWLHIETSILGPS